MSIEPFAIESTGTPRHDHNLPGRWRRRRLGLHPGAVLRCQECDLRWTLVNHPMFGIEWWPDRSR